MLITNSRTNRIKNFCSIKFSPKLKFSLKFRKKNLHPQRDYKRNPFNILTQPSDCDDKRTHKQTDNQIYKGNPFDDKQTNFHSDHKRAEIPISETAKFFIDGETIKFKLLVPSGKLPRQMDPIMVRCAYSPHYVLISAFFC